MPVAVKIALALLPHSKRLIPIIVTILLLPVILIFALTSSMITIISVPAITDEQISFYKEAVTNVELETDLLVNWKELVAIDAVRYKQNFSKATVKKAEELAWRFIKIVKKKDKDGNIIILYYLKPLDQVLEEMIEQGEIKREDIQLIMQYLQVPWDGEGDGVGELPDGWVPIPSQAGYVFPIVGQWTVSDVFRKRTNPVTGKKEEHLGVDLAAAEGTSVVAAKEGIVILAKLNGTAGNEVRIDHGDGTVTRYLHMHSFIVHKGDNVSAGQLIGAVGTTGQSTGPHLHFELHRNGVAVDPVPFIFSKKE